MSTELGKLLTEILSLKAQILSEARTREKKEKNRISRENKAKSRGQLYDPDYKEPEREDEPEQPMRPGKTLTKKIKSGEKSEKDLEPGDKLDKETGKVTKAAKQSLFKNDESFSDTPEDAHLHTDDDCKEGLRARHSASEYAKAADAETLKKHPCEKSYPIFAKKSEKARIAGGLRMAYQYKDKEAIAKLSAAARAIGMHPKGALWNERPECQGLKKGQRPQKKDGTLLPKKYCKKHGPGGGSEWLRKGKESGDAKKEGGTASERKTHRAPGTGHSDSQKEPLRDYPETKGIRMPSKFASNQEKLFAAHGGEHGTYLNRVTRNIDKETLKKFGLERSDTGAVLHSTASKLKALQKYIDAKRKGH